MFQISLKAARVNAGLTREEAALLLNIQPRTLVSWETGRSYPRGEAYLRLCRLYRCPVDAVFLP